ncbi:M81 family metallopeptidase [Ponticoccus sp. SC2-23]|uniref:M81 family metallopeptidase n=1 Tax=Alexandriicola marinus TaxID=2081710 RepID=UPI000FDBA07F|nr:M81 family metallopeptidase [Alexandriicola marinus]MBM1221111.1 M81 family metallopeptidase [Ponticoccus sp. SC6-9]MBM1225681.1 M81 family metallopeptidase [Ponticoccus sp. SC6-15]MBM1227833.1 M81 family metallopeptidase [Ponticoccus sp. SC6-38]MBM1234529.1 M81 family metallopeptidase [Ponticoccus sp. SC6-45]MBM1238335.1 M81 family metallopeptidase [Ponticoccus sp. SC6-49]MBM1243604.1 M81 family metallopeptidase [Ponticoccus sp. SC2-64]MBM1248053.1 M81 family metallopeptidase [Ponticoccu
MTGSGAQGRRVAVASIMQETNTFSPIPTTVALFESYYIHRGSEMREGFGAARVEVPAVLATLDAAGVEAVPLIAAYAAAAGPMQRPDFERLVSEIETRLDAAGRVDGLILVLHGALVIEDQPDGDGEIIARMRARLPEGVPIGVSLDLHGHITPLMLQPETFHVGYQCYPHTDMFETGERVARLMIDTLEGRCRPVMALAKCPVIVPPVCGRTTDGPLSEVARAARRMEADGLVRHASIFPVQPWIDVPDLGFAALVCADGDQGAAQAAADTLAQMVMDVRDEFPLGLTPLAEVIRIAHSSDGMTLAADTGDAPTGGAAADNVAVLRAVLETGADRKPGLTLLTLCDPQAAGLAHQAGVDREIEVALGHRFSVLDGAPLIVTAKVISVSDGRYVMSDAGAQGLAMDMGPTAVLGIGQVRVLVRSRPSMEWDRAMYLSQGLDPAAASLVFVKSPSHFRESFGPLAARILLADTPGPTRADIGQLPYRRVTRPLSPLDPI